MNRIITLIRARRELASSLFPPCEDTMRRQLSAVQKLQSFYNLIWEVLSQHFYCILLVRSESVGPAHTQEEGIMKGHEYQVVGGSLGSS